MTRHLNNIRLLTAFAQTPNRPRAISPQIGTNRSVLVRAILGSTAVGAIVGLLATNLMLSTVAQSRLNAQAPIAIQQPRNPVSRPELSEIVASPVIDPQPALFIGTGDGRGQN
jgi:hypothetical protein